MKFTNVDELYDCLSEASAKGENVSPKDIRDFVKDQILAADQKWKEMLDAKANEAVELQRLLDESKAAIKDFEAVRKELDETKAAVKDQENKNVFNERMAELDNKYDLSDKTRQVIAKNIMGKSDTEYQAWLAEDGEVILAGKEKKTPQTEVTPEEGLKESKASVTFVPNADVQSEPVKENKQTVTVAKQGGTFVIKLNNN